MSSKKKAVFVISIAVIILTAGMIAYQIRRFIIIRQPITERVFPIWYLSAEGNYGAVIELQQDEYRRYLFPLYFPVIDTLNDVEIKGYPAAYCKQCKKPFAFITEKYEPGMKPDKCPLCGNTGQESLVVLDDGIKILDLNLIHEFPRFAQLDFILKHKRLREHWIKLQKDKKDKSQDTGRSK